MGTKICCIYKITSPSGRIYIGQTIDFDSRIKRYKRLCCKSQRKLYYSLKKYGFSKHTIEQIHICSPEELNRLEESYVNLYKTLEYGLNLRGGGNGGGKVSEESKAKQRGVKRLRKLSILNDKK